MLCRETRHGDDDPSFARAAGEGENMRRHRPFGFQFRIIALGEQVRPFPAQRQGAGDHRLLHRPALPVFQQLRRCGALPQRRFARGKIHRPAVVRINQALVPELRALVEIRHAGRGQAQQRLRQAVERAGEPPAVPRNAMISPRHRTRRIKRGGEEILRRGLIFLVRRGPFGDQFRLAYRFLEPGRRHAG